MNSGHVMTPACVLIPIGPSATLADLLRGRTIATVFSPRERRRGGGPPSFAGRLAGKLAVLELLRPPENIGLASIEILPGRCDAPAGRCHRSHRPTVVLSADIVSPRGWFDVSISHTRASAIALAVFRPQVVHDRAQ